MKGERKKFKLASSNRVGRNQLVSETVLIDLVGLKFYCYVRFSDEFVEFVGKELPQGVSETNPAFIRAYMPSVGGSWFVQAAYWTKSKKDIVYHTLWVTEEKPSWLKFYKPKKAKNGNPEKAQ